MKYEVKSWTLNALETVKREENFPLPGNRQRWKEQASLWTADECTCYTDATADAGQWGFLNI